MGNYYKRNRFFRLHHGGKSRRKGFFLGGVTLLILAVAICSLGDDALKEQIKAGKVAVSEVMSSAVGRGKDLLGGSAIDLAIPVSSGVVVEKFGVVTEAGGKEAYHNGIDIRVPAESEVLAAADGKVSDISTHDDGTVWITVAHEKNWFTVYGRLGETGAAVGDEIKKGDVLGVPANEILHFEVLEKEIEKDPVQYLEKGA